MRSEYLENVEYDYDRGNTAGALVGLAGGIYGWSVLDMLADFSKTGKYYIPWTGFINKGKGPISYSMNIPKEALGAGLVRLPEAVGGAITGKGAVEGVSRAAWGSLALSRAAGVGLTAMAWSDPVWFALTFWNKPLMWPLGYAWFRGQKLARSLEAHKYVSLGSGYFPETKETFTSRQRAVRAIAESQLQARAAIGSEAMLFHRA